MHVSPTNGNFNTFYDCLCGVAPVLNTLPLSPTTARHSFPQNASINRDRQ